MEKELQKAMTYYDKFSKVYNWFSPKWYYHSAREYAIKQLSLKEGSCVVNVPCGTGQNLEYMQAYLKNTGLIVGIDLSDGMLNKATSLVNKNDWNNTRIMKADVRKVDTTWVENQFNGGLQVDAILCDLGLSGFPNWKSVIDNLYDILLPQGRLVIMDWYIPKPTITGEIVKWVGKGEVDRPLYQYLNSKTSNFSVNTSFNRGRIFVTRGIKS